jgi:cold shock CspA family protein
MLTGRLVRFDYVKGYGFIAPDGGGDDVFVHANDFGGEDKYMLQPGLTVEFEAEESERGPKVVMVRVADREPVGRQRRPVATVPLRASAPHNDLPAEEEAMCDVLSASSFQREITELLLAEAPSLTAAQIVQVRTSMVESGRRHGWIEN